MNPEDLEHVYNLDLSALERERLEAITNHVLNLLPVNDMLAVMMEHNVYVAAIPLQTGKAN